MPVYKAKEKTKDGRTWYFKVYYTNIDNVRKVKKSKKYMTKKEAEEQERIFLSCAGEQISNDLTLDEVFELYKSNYTLVKESTIYTHNDRYRAHIKEYLGDKKITKITESDIENWKSKIDINEKEYETSYKQAIFNVLSSIFRFAKDNKIIKTNIMKNINNFAKNTEEIIDDTNKVRYITPEEFNIFQSVIEDLTDKAYFYFLYYMGVRKGEAGALKWTDIDFNTNKVKIIKQISFRTFKKGHKETNTKNKKNRIISMPTQLVNILKQHYNEQSKICNFDNSWFVFGGLEYLPYTTISRHCDNYFKLAGLNDKRITIHEFRHSHASLLISNKVPTNLIAERLGDTIEVVLNTYAHLFPETEKVIIDVLENLGTI